MSDLVVDNLVVEYSSGGYAIRPIDDLSLKLPSGSLVVVMGPSGCGKTTLLSCLGGLLAPKSGTIRFGDVDVTGADDRALATYRRNSVGFVFQAFNLVPSLTALENVMVPLRAARVPRVAARARAAEVLGSVNLGDHVNRRPGDLSGGQQQRVALARALALNPKLILADEPTAHLDFIQVEDVLRLIHDLAKHDRVVVVATHDHRIVPLADEVIELVPSGPRPEVAGPPEVVELPAGRVLFRQGDVGDLIYVVERGEVEVMRERADGTEELIKVELPGAYFGEMGPLCGIPRSATARARTDAVLTAYGVRAFRTKMGPRGIGVLAGEPAAAEEGQETTGPFS